MPMYRATATFVIGSRIAWDDRDDGIDEHLDSMIAALRGREDVGAVELDLDRSRDLLFVQIQCHVPEANKDAEHAIRTVLSEAIRASGGRHEELLPLGEESRAKPKSNQWSGLRTLRWGTRAFTFEPIPKGEGDDD